MSRSLTRQARQIRRTPPAEINDKVPPSEANYETDTETIQDDLNNLRSAVNNILSRQIGEWHDDLNVPSFLEIGTQRALFDLNNSLHAVEKQRKLVIRTHIVNVVVGAGNNFAILSAPTLPPNTTAAVGVSTTKGTVVAAHPGPFGSHSLAEIVGSHEIAPLNLVLITDAEGSSICSGERRIWGLLQSESASDGHTLSNSTPNRLQISFVKPNLTNTDLVVVPVEDIQGKTFRYFPVERTSQESQLEQDEQESISMGAAVDPSGLSASKHRNLDQLVHDIAEDSFTEVSYAGNRVTALTVWTSAAKTTKIREELYTYTGNKVTTIVTNQYDENGALKETYTETITYVGSRVNTITGVLVP